MFITQNSVIRTRHSVWHRDDGSQSAEYRQISPWRWVIIAVLIHLAKMAMPRERNFIHVVRIDVAVTRNTHRATPIAALYRMGVGTRPWWWAVSICALLVVAVATWHA